MTPPKNITVRIGIVRRMLIQELLARKITTQTHTSLTVVVCELLDDAFALENISILDLYDSLASLLQAYEEALVEDGFNLKSIHEIIEGRQPTKFEKIHIQRFFGIIGDDLKLLQENRNV